MYVSDQKALTFLAGTALVLGPWFGATYASWNWILEIALLWAVIAMGRRDGGLPNAAGYLVIGYAAAFASKGFAWEYISLLPLAGLWVVWGLKQGFRQREVVLGGLVAAGLAGVLPVLFLMQQGVPQESIQEFAAALLEQYRQTGMLDMLRQQGFTEAEVLTMMTQTASFFVLVTPALAALTGMILWSIVYYVYARWFPAYGQKYLPFHEWRLPWYGVWGFIVALAAYLLGDYWHWLPLRNFGINVMLVYAPVAWVLGTAVLVWILRSPRFSRFIKAILIFTMFLYLYMTFAMLVILGLLDLVLDFRKTINEKKNPDGLS